MCEILEIPRSTYYQTLTFIISNRQEENQALTEKILLIYIESKARYGAPKIHQVLLKDGIKVSLKRVQRLMKKANLRSITTRKFRPQPSKEVILDRENILNQDFTTTTLNEKWVADITYIHTLKDGWCYLASVLDLYSKKIVGFSFSRSMTKELVLQALQNAVSAQKPRPGLIIHTDLGTQVRQEVA